MDHLQGQINPRRKLLPSTRFANSSWPFHIDTAHWPIPVRYIMLYCEEAEEQAVDTLLLSRKELSFDTKLHNLSHVAQFVIGHGQNCFLSTILSPNFSFLRYDPACMRPRDEDGRLLLHLISQEISALTPQRIVWRKGRLLIIDNWHYLHAPMSSLNRGNRVLARIYIK